MQCYEKYFKNKGSTRASLEQVADIPISVKIGLLLPLTRSRMAKLAEVSLVGVVMDPSNFVG